MYGDEYESVHRHAFRLAYRHVYRRVWTHACTHARTHTRTHTLSSSSLPSRDVRPSFNSANGSPSGSPHSHTCTHVRRNALPLPLSCPPPPPLPPPSLHYHHRCLRCRPPPLPSDQQRQFAVYGVLARFVGLAETCIDATVTAMVGSVVRYIVEESAFVAALGSTALAGSLGLIDAQVPDRTNAPCLNIQSPSHPLVYMPCQCVCLHAYMTPRMSMTHVCA